MSAILGGLQTQAADQSSDHLALKDVWEIYIKLVKSYDRSADTVKKQNVTLDVLLQLCAGEIDDRKTLSVFSDMKSVCNQLCKEFMSDIVRITSAATDDEEEDVARLHNYLLEGRGWILLQVIQRSGVQNVSGGRDLANLLISLLPWCLKFPMQPPCVSEEDGLPQTQFLPILQCFQEALRSARTKLSKSRNNAVPLSRQSNQSDLQTDSVPEEKQSSRNNGSRKLVHKRRSTQQREEMNKDGDSSDMQDVKTKEKTRRKPKPVRAYHSANMYSQQKPDSDSEDDDICALLGKYHREPRKSSAMELCLLMLELLMELCNSDHKQTSAVKCLSPSMLPHLLQALLITENIVIDGTSGRRTSLTGTDDEAKQRSLSELLCRITIQRSLLRVIFTACSILAAQQNGVNILLGHKIVSHILSIGQRCSIWGSDFEEKRLFSQRQLLEMGLVSDVVTGLLYCFHVVFHHLPFNPIFIQSAVTLIEEFDDMQGFYLLRKHILYVDSLKQDPSANSGNSEWIDEDSVKIFGSFLNTMKVVRVNYVHSMKCVKRKHQKCEYTQYFDHHHDILGVTPGDEGQPKEEGSLLMTRLERTGSQSNTNGPPIAKTICLVSSCTELLLDMLTKVTTKVMRIEIIRTIYTSGVCCCMKMEKIVSALVCSVGNFSPAVRSFALDALNKIILEHFGGGIPTDRSLQRLYICTYCKIQTDVSTMKYSIGSEALTAEHPCLTAGEGKGLDSGFSSSDRESKFFPLYKLSKWKALHQVKCLLYSDKECLAISLAKHLLVLAVKGNAFLKAELFFSIYYDTLGTVEVSSQTKSKPALSKSVQVHCLSALPYLLQANCVTKAFLTKNGILKMLELLEDETLRAPVLRIFEALVVLDEQKLGNISTQDECPCPYKGGLVIGSFIEELSKRSFTYEDGLTRSFDYQDEEDVRPRGRVRHDSVVLAQWTLPVLVDLWETCAKLCVHSRAFVTIFCELQCLRKTEGLLLETLQVLLSMYPMKKEDGDTDMEDSGLEESVQHQSSGFFMRITLLESLIVVCGACGTIEQRVRKASSWMKNIKQQMKGSSGLEPSKLKVLFEAVLNAAMPQYLSILEYSYSRNIALVYMRDDDVYDEDEVRQLLLTGSEDEVEHFTTELGYDADSEDTSLEDSENDRQLKFRKLLTRIPKKVYFPAVFRLLLELLITVKQTDIGTLVISPVLHKLLQTACVDQNVVKAMCEENLLELMLSDKGLWDLLIQKDDTGTVQDGLLALTQELAQRKIWSHDLRKVLQLFNHSDIPMEKLLSVLLTVVENSGVTPRYSLTFPVPRSEVTADNGDAATAPEWGDLSLRSSLSSSSCLLGTDDTEFSMNTQEVWQTCAVQVRLKDSLVWPPYQIGVSLAMWIQVEKGQGHSPGGLTEADKSILKAEGGIVESLQDMEVKPTGRQQQYTTENCLHLVSMGTREKLLEVWMNPLSCSLLFRLTSEVSEMGLVVRETELKGIISPDSWHHLVFSYVENLDGSTTAGQVLVVIDGCQFHSFILDYPYSAIQTKQRTPKQTPQLCIGHTAATNSVSPAGTLSLGSLMLFKGDILRKVKSPSISVRKETCFHLYSLGPNCSTISKTDCGEELFSYSPHLSKQVVVSSKIQYDYLVGLKKVVLSELRGSLLLSYNAKNPNEVSMYNQTVKSPVTGQLSPNLGLHTDMNLLIQQPQQISPVLQGTLIADVNTGLEMAVEECGGPAVILFLVARVYECCDDKMRSTDAERHQATALQVLFSIIHHSSKMMQEYLNIGGHSLLSKVLTSSHSVIGHQTLKVLMDASTSESLFRVNADTGKLVLRQRSEAVIRDITVIEHLLLNWQIWETSDPELFILLFSALVNLVREDHRHQTFNVKQYEVINLINKIFKIYQERIQEGYPSLPVSVSHDAIAIIRSMTGSPPDYQMITYLCDFLLLVHPAANTYINHSRSGFYFSLMWGLPDSPLTRWKQEQRGPPMVTSTPVKDSTDQESEALKEKKNLQSMFDELEELTVYPDVELATEVKARAQSDPTSSFSPRKLRNASHKSPSKNITYLRQENDRLETQSDSQPETLPEKEKSGELTDELYVSLTNRGSDAGSLDNDLDGSLPDVQVDMSFNSGDREPDCATEKSKNVSEMKEKLSLRFDKDNMEINKQEEGLIALCFGLLRLLSEIILTMPDTLTEKTFQKSINPRILIVLAHNSNPEIRESIIKVLSSYLSRSNHQHLDSFLRMEGFHLLSAQLLQYPTHEEQMEAAISLVLRRPFKLDDGIHEMDVLEELTQVQQSAVSVMLALLGNSTNDLALCHNSLEACLSLFDFSNVLATVMVDLGLVEVLCNMVMKLLDDTDSFNTDVEGVDENEILLRDLQQFYGAVAVREFSASTLQHYQHFEDILTLLKDMEQKKTETDGLKSKAVQTLQIFQHDILLRVFTLVQDASEEVSQQSFSLFTKVSTSKPSHILQDNIGYHSFRKPFKPSLPQPLSTRPQSLTTLSQYGGRSAPSSSPLSSETSTNQHKKPQAGLFLPSDRLYTEVSGTGQNVSGDSDSSQDSFQASIQTINLPVVSRVYNRAKSMDISQTRLVRSNSLLQSVLSIGKRKKLSTIPISQSELIDRLKKVLTLAIDLTMFTERQGSSEHKVVLLFENSSHPVSVEREFQRRLLNFTYKAFETTLTQEKGFYKRTKNVIMWGAKDVLRVQLGRLLCLMLSSDQEFDQKVFALSYMMGQERGADVLKKITSTSDVGPDLGYNLYYLMKDGQKWLSNQQVEDGAKFINLLSSIGFSVPSPRKMPSMEVQEMLYERKQQIQGRHDSQKNVWLKRRHTSLTRILQKYDGLATVLSAHAMEVTQAVTQLQTQERNKFITHIKQNMTGRIQVKKHWQEIVQNLTHERALWYDKKSYPQSWQLNPTEGPCRVRKRLQRGHLGLDRKFLKPDFQHKLDAEQYDPPLIYLFEDDHQMSDAAALIYQLHKNKKIRYTSTCRAVSPNSESKGELLIGEDSVFFVADEAITDANYTQVLLGNRDQLSMTWPFEDIHEILKRWYELMDRGLEIFLTNGKTCLLAFKSTLERDRLFQHLIDLELPNRVNSENLLDIVDDWTDGRMTNFEYLTHLNKIAGRSFNDLMQYPVIPFILKDYVSQKLDLQDRGIYRDLSKPVSVQEGKNEEKFMTTYSILNQDYEKYGKEGITGLRVAPYHYGSHYSNSGTVLHYLVRMPPFTKMFLNFQDQSFDIPDRTFHNLNTSWRLSSAESNTDVKELIPEFFFFHEFFINNEGFAFGKKQTNEEVCDVVLPPWCEDNPRLFVLIHRQALESDYLTQNITSWIDLVFGCKQQGEAAVRAINVFHPATYFGIDVSGVKDPLDRKAIRTMVRTYGQTPKQLFKIRHPKRNIPPRTENVKHTLQPVKTVTGLKWGFYLGSPGLPDPEPVWQKTYDLITSCMVPLPAGSVAGISSNSCLLAQHSKVDMKSSDSRDDVIWAAIVTWGHPDGMIRIINEKNKPPVNFLQHSHFEEITCCVSVPDCRYLFTGGTAGVITIYSTKHNSAKESELQVFGHRKCLYGHIANITSLVVCKPYSILVSSSEDKTCIIWDLNRHSYVRSITSHKAGVKVLAVSSTLGDIASVSSEGMGSALHLHTVNAELVTKTTCEDTITCLTYSNAPEGVSINVIAGGLSNGKIRLWSSWDLTPVRDLVSSDLLARPVVSLTFTYDSQRLFTAHSDGRVVLWDTGNNSQKPRPRFKPYLYAS